MHACLVRKEDLCNVQESPHEFLAHYKGTNNNLPVENLVNTMLTSGSKLTSPVLRQTNLTCFPVRYNEGTEHHLHKAHVE